LGREEKINWEKKKKKKEEEKEKEKTLKKKN